MKKSILSVAILTLIVGSVNAQTNNIPGFINDSTTTSPGSGLGGSMSGSTGASGPTGSPGYTGGSSATGTPGTDTTQFPNTGNQQRMEDFNNQNLNNPNLNVPQTQPNLPQTQPTNSTNPGTGMGTGIGTGRGVGTGATAP